MNVAIDKGKTTKYILHIILGVVGVVGVGWSVGQTWMNADGICVC